MIILNIAFGVLGIEPKALGMLSKHCTTVLHPNTHNILFIGTSYIQFTRKLLACQIHRVLWKQWLQCWISSILFMWNAFICMCFMIWFECVPQVHMLEAWSSVQWSWEMGKALRDETRTIGVPSSEKPDDSLPEFVTKWDHLVHLASSACDLFPLFLYHVVVQPEHGCCAIWILQWPELWTQKPSLDYKVLRLR